MLIKLEGIWVNPAHVVQVYESAHSGFSTIELANPDERMQVRGVPDEVAEKLNAGDMTDAHLIARNALEDIIRAANMHTVIASPWLVSVARAGLGRLPD